MTVRNIAVIGAGYWGKNLVRNFHQLGVLKTICDHYSAIHQMMAKDYPDTLVTDDFNALLSDPAIQAVVIAAPAAQHYTLATQVLDAGKHCFVEKPLALTYEEGVALVRLAEAKKKILFVGHILQYHPAVVRLKEIINKGTIGRLQYIYSRRLSFGKIRREENILWSFAPHDISIILSLADEEPSYVDSVGSNFLHARIADVTMTNLKFPSGIGAHIFVSWLNPFKEQKLVIVGSNGMLVFDDTEPVEKKLIHYPHVIKWQNGQPVPQKAEELTIDLKDVWEEPLKAECEAFMKAIETNTKPLTSGEEGLKVLKILEISQKSLEQKEIIGEKNRDGCFFCDSKMDKRPICSTSYFDDVFIHPTAIIDDNVTIGKGTKIWHFSHILSGAKINENCNIGQNVVIGPDVSIGSNCKIQNNVSVYKGVRLEDGVFCGPSMVFTNICNPRAEIAKMAHIRPTLVKKGATLGANCTIVCGHTIGSYAFIGAGAIVTKDIPDHALMVGNPARQIGWMCECGEKIDKQYNCNQCKRAYKASKDGLRIG